jgi:hypothetical protein
MRSFALAVIAAGVVMSRPAESATVSELPSVLVITKSSNRTEVHYAAWVDAACAPATSAPVHPYWLMRERGPNVTEALQSRELRVLGVAGQEVSGAKIRFSIRAMPSRGFTAHTARDKSGACTSWVETEIAGAPARLTAVFVQQALFGVDYVQLTGRSADEKVVSERVSP